MYSIWAEPTAKDAKYLLKIIHTLGKKYDAPIFHPHITVFSGICRDSAAKSSLQNFEGLNKFTVRTANLDFSGNLWKTVFINVEKNQKLKQIHNIIKQNIPNTKYEFRPHISLIYKKLPNPEKQHIINNLKIKQKFTFDKITVIASSRDVREWQIVDRVVLI